MWPCASSPLTGVFFGNLNYNTPSPTFKSTYLLSFFVLSLLAERGKRREGGEGVEMWYCWRRHHILLLKVLRAAKVRCSRLVEVDLGIESTEDAGPKWLP